MLFNYDWLRAECSLCQVTPLQKWLYGCKLQRGFPKTSPRALAILSRVRKIKLSLSKLHPILNTISLNAFR